MTALRIERHAERMRQQSRMPAPRHPRKPPGIDARPSSASQDRRLPPLVPKLPVPEIHPALLAYYASRPCFMCGVTDRMCRHREWDVAMAVIELAERTGLVAAREAEAA